MTAMLNGYKDILAKLREVWGIDVGMRALMRWCNATIDPLPIKRINPTGGPRPIVLADPAAVEAWARRHVK